MYYTYLNVEEVLKVKDMEYFPMGVWFSFLVTVVISIFYYIGTGGDGGAMVGVILWFGWIVAPIGLYFYIKHKDYMMKLEWFIIFQDDIVKSDRVYMAYRLKLDKPFGKTYIDNLIKQRKEVLDTKHLFIKELNK